MTRAISPARFGSEYDDFLFSPIGEDRKGLMLSVVSMLARLNLDPWHKAASFAELPVEAATEQLASLIAALPDHAFKHFDPAALAARLIALLPRKPPDDPAIPALASSLVPGTALRPRQLASMVVFILFVGLLAAQFFLSSHRPPRPEAAPHGQAPSAELRQARQ